MSTLHLPEKRVPGEANTLPQRVFRSLDEIDNMPAPLRECVHEFGYAIVIAFKNAGIRDPKVIGRLVRECWDGARQPHQEGKMGIPREEESSPVLKKLDWLMVQANAAISAKTLLRFLYMHRMVILPLEPSTPMLNASLEYTRDKGILSKDEKHRGRLRVAIEAGARRLWPHLFKP